MSLLSQALSGNAAQSLVNFLGIGVLLPLVEAQLLAQAASAGESSLERAIELPDNLVQKACEKSGADHATALNLRNEAARLEAHFLIYLATGQLPGNSVPID